MIEKPIVYQYAFRDSNPEEGIREIITTVFGVPMETYESAKRLGDKNVMGQTIVMRRKDPSEPWEDCDDPDEN